MVAIDSSSSCGPQPKSHGPPMADAPKPIVVGVQVGVTQFALIHAIPPTGADYILERADRPSTNASRMHE